jgi:hypothetical protein
VLEFSARDRETGYLGRDGMLGARREVRRVMECSACDRETGCQVRNGMLGTGPGRECEDGRCKPERALAT